MVQLQRRPLGEPDDVRQVPIGRLETVYVSWATRELLAGSPIGFADRGLHGLKGLSEKRRIYQVEPEPSS